MQTIKTPADLNKHNSIQAGLETRRLSTLVGNGEVAIRTAANIRLAITTGSFFSSINPVSILSLAEEAERQIGPEKGKFARRHNAKLSRMGTHRIGPTVKLPADAPISSYRLERSLPGFFREHVRRAPKTPKKESWINLEKEIGTISDDGAVERYGPYYNNGELDLRTQRYSFKIGEKSYDISFGQFEKYYTEGRKSLETAC